MVCELSIGKMLLSRSNVVENDSLATENPALSPQPAMTDPLFGQGHDPVCDRQEPRV